jgi:hypothetical protein
MPLAVTPRHANQAKSSCSNWAITLNIKEILITIRPCTKGRLQANCVRLVAWRHATTGRNWFWVGDMSKKMFDATCRVSACVCASLPQNATDLLNLHLYTAAVWFIISVTQILKHYLFLCTGTLEGMYTRETELILFSEDAWFHFIGQVNSHSNRYWSS